MIKVRYSSIDGVLDRRTFKTLKGAQKFAHGMVGAHPEIGPYYAVSGDGVGMVHVYGATLLDLFPPTLQVIEIDEEADEAAIYGDGRATFHYGQDGDPRNGERIFNTREDDAARDAEIVAEGYAWRKAMSPEDYGWDDLPF